MAEQADAKKMGYGEYEVFKKFRKTLRQKGAKSDQVYRKVKNVMKNGHSDTSDPKSRNSNATSQP